MSSTTMSTDPMKVEVPPVLTLLMLPNELILSCLARVPRLYYPTLTLVSKSFRSLINSPELCKTRSLLARTESCLYVWFQFQNDENTHWFTLYRNPYQTVDDNSQTNKLGGYKLVPIPSLDSPPSAMSVVAAVGSDIYAIGGSIDGVSSSGVFVMDSHYHTWCKAPSMHVARVSPSASVLDGKIYVVGGSKNLDYTNWMEVYDTKTQTWEFVPSPGEDIDGRFGYKSASLEGSVYVMDRAKYETFKLNKGRWRVADQKLTTGWRWDSGQFYYCVTENVLYYYSSIDLCWYDFIDRQWRGVKGLEGRLPWYRRFRNTYHHRLADYGGKLVFLWKEDVHTENVQNTTLVWCAEISLERLHRSEIYGTVEWCDVVFTYTTQVDQENTTQVELMHVIATTA
uniref:F-box domain-containing protein n=1 Tax=Brassica oleracea TaxID=3712 RepID=A0A3P6EM94_BRAOL|nr:unnamed protein product [Brassica oleracea]